MVVRRFRYGKNLLESHFSLLSSLRSRGSIKLLPVERIKGPIWLIQSGQKGSLCAVNVGWKFGAALASYDVRTFSPCSCFCDSSYLSRTGGTQPSENHPSAQLVDAARLLQGSFRLLGVVEYLPGGLSGRLDPIEGST